MLALSLCLDNWVHLRFGVEWQVVVVSVVNSVRNCTSGLINLLARLNCHRGKRYFIPPTNRQTLFVNSLVSHKSRRVTALRVIFTVLSTSITSTIVNGRRCGTLTFTALSPGGPRRCLHSRGRVRVHRRRTFLTRMPFNSRHRRC